LSDIRRPPATLLRCLLSSGSRVRILPGAPGQSVAGIFACVTESQSVVSGKRRGRGEDSVYCDEAKHQFVGAVSLGYSPSGTRVRKKVMGRTKTEVRDALRELHARVDSGVRPRRHYTVSDALDDWLATGLDGLAPSTVTLYRNTIAKALREELGSVKLTSLTAGVVQKALANLAARRSTRTVQIAHNLLGAGDSAC
jgi:hypothetical protein